MYLHILNKQGPHNEVVETPHKDVVVAYRFYEGKVEEAFFYDTVLAILYEKTVIGNTLLLRRPETGEIVLEAVLSNDPVLPTATRMYVPQSFISWEVRMHEDVDLLVS